MLEHLAAHCAGLDPSETAVFADQMNEAILSVFAAAIDNKAAIDDDIEDSVPINNKLTPRDVGYIPNEWVDAVNCVEREKWLTAAHIELKAQIKNGTWKTVDRKTNKTSRKPLTLRWLSTPRKTQASTKPAWLHVDLIRSKTLISTRFMPWLQNPCLSKFSAQLLQL